MGTWGALYHYCISVVGMGQDMEEPLVLLPGMQQWVDIATPSFDRRNDRKKRAAYVL